MIKANYIQEGNISGGLISGIISLLADRWAYIVEGAISGVAYNVGGGELMSGFAAYVYYIL